jgi:xylulose-5-phosphate/fructose-6-phosphate phosphoketolase
MCVRNELDRYHLALDVIERVPGLGSMRDEAIQKFTEQRQKHKLYVSQFGEDLPEVRNWRWSLAAPEGETIHQDTGSDNV